MGGFWLHHIMVDSIVIGMHAGRRGHVVRQEEMPNVLRIKTKTKLLQGLRQSLFQRG